MAKQTETALSGLTGPQFLMLSVHTAAALGWSTGFPDGDLLEIRTRRGWNSYGEKITVTIHNDSATIESKPVQWQLYDFGRNAKNLEAFTNKLDELRLLYSADDLTASINQLYAEREAYQANLQERIQEGNLTANEKIVLGVGGHTVTYTLIGINLLVFIIMSLSGVSMFSPTTADVLQWGGNFKPMTLDGQWWRLLTCVFVHIGLFHVLFNMYALYFLGMYLEPLLGKWKFLLLYICTGIIASLASIWWNGDRVSAGASGAIFGLGGVFIALLSTKLIDGAARKSLLQSMAIFVGYNLLYGTKQGIDNAAHIGGLISGLGLGYLIYLGMQKPSFEKISMAATDLITLVVSASYLLTASNDVLYFQHALNQFSLLEEKAISPLQHDIPEESLADSLNTVSLPAWKEAKKDLAATKQYNLPDLLVQQRDLMDDYIDLRIKETNLLTNIHSHKQQPSDSTALSEVQAGIKDKIEALKALFK